MIYVDTPVYCVETEDEAGMVAELSYSDVLGPFTVCIEKVDEASGTMSTLYEFSLKHFLVAEALQERSVENAHKFIQVLRSSADIAESVLAMGAGAALKEAAEKVKQ